MEFTLDAPNGNFPYLVSSDNYNLIILPKTYTGDWESTFIGTGPWKLETYTPEVGVTYVKNPDYWDTSRMPLADTSEVKFYEDEQARVLALQGGEVDIVSNFSVAGGGALLEDPSVTLIEIRAAQHRKIHMRTDKEPFTDKRVRQAMALAVDRQALVDGLFDGRPTSATTARSRPSSPRPTLRAAAREQDLEQARQLLADAGMGDGLNVKLESWQGFEIPDLAVLVQNAAEAIGVTVELQITDDGAYYGDFTYGGSRWLDSPFGITDWGHRGVPNVFLSSALGSKGPGTRRTSRTPRSTSSSPTTSPPSTSTRSGPSPSRSRSCSSTRRPRSSPTSTTTSRRRRTSRGSSRPGWATST